MLNRLFVKLICVWACLWITQNAEAKVEEVSNAEQLMESIGSNKHLKIVAPLVNLHDFALDKFSRLEPYVTEFYTIYYTSYTTYHEKIEQVEFTIEIHDVENLVIESGMKDSCWLVTSAVSGNVLNFERCKEIKFRGLTLGHYPESGYCTGNVLEINNSIGVNLDHCRLFGSGLMGLIAQNTDRLTITHTIIDDCSESILSLGRCNEAVFKNCIFKNTPGGLDIYYGIERADFITAKFYSCVFENLGESGIFSWECTSYNGSCLHFYQCKFPSNTIEQALGSQWKDNIELKNCNFNGRYQSNKKRNPTIPLN